MRLVQIAISLAIIVFVAWIGDRQRHLAGLASAMPLTIPLTMWIVFSNTGKDYQQTAEFAGGALTSILGTTVFVVMCYLLLRARVNFWMVIAGGYAAWAVVIYLLPLIARHAGRWLALMKK